MIISGPCSAESREQLINTAIQLSDIPDVKIFRAGIWKPRTRPNSFEGVGTIGLEWLNEAKSITGLLTAVEVANPYHLEECLKHNIDIIWLGARTTVNPFSIQEISQALRGVDIPVMIKNPVNPDLHLWLGAIERIYNAGINKIIAIHRGFSTVHKSEYRNEPVWDIPIELMRICPTLPVICDPSHIGGNKKILLSIAQKALNLEMHGLIIESHVNPKCAKTDARQQITPIELSELLDNLIIRKLSPRNKLINSLEKMRAELDAIDDTLLNTLAKRMYIVNEIGKFKAENNLTILQLKRWNKTIITRLEIAEKLGLKDDFVLKLLALIHEESIKMQNDIYNKKL